MNPFSSLEFVTPAFTKGIPEQLESLNLALSEIAIYASLFLTLFTGAHLGGFAAPSSKYFNQRFEFETGFMSGIGLLIINIVSSVSFRLASSALARESDMLVFISKTRYWHWLNLLLFAAGVVSGIIFCFRSSYLISLE